MASPFGHSLLGLAVGRAFGGEPVARSWPWWLFCIAAANAPDLDFIPGLLLGDINRFHQGISHSIPAAVFFGGLAWLVARPRSAAPMKIGMVGAGLYGSHLLMDFFSEDRRAPFGQPLLFPFFSEHFIAPWAIFGGVKHGIPGDDFLVFFDDLISWHNAKAIGLETFILLPILLLSWLLRGNGWRRIDRAGTENPSVPAPVFSASEGLKKRFEKARTSHRATQ